MTSASPSVHKTLKLSIRCTITPYSRLPLQKAMETCYLITFTVPLLTLFVQLLILVTLIYPRLRSTIDFQLLIPEHVTKMDTTQYCGGIFLIPHFLYCTDHISATIPTYRVHNTSLVRSPPGKIMPPLNINFFLYEEGGIPLLCGYITIKFTW